MLTIENLHVSVHGKEILHGVNLHIPKGEVHALFGPNGTGKSVLIMTIMGYPDYEITQGRILFDNQDLAGFSIDERVKAGLGLSEQRPPTIKGVKLQNLLDLLIPKDENDRAYVEKMIKKFHIERFLDREINDGLSGGEIKQAELFLVLTSQPKFLILDEPDSGVDPEHLKKIGQMINESLRNKKIEKNLPKAHLRRHAGLIVTHSAAILDFIHTDRAHVMVNGKIKCSGNPGIMMDQIRAQGYDYCITCQNGKGDGI
ncbi:MAG: ABC transporter ATP-binding protein [Candidatus Vecturithrix sp.]|nr:ABC transporter ATP-binding protein [Candidatus Vecturithrix sp.]